jgi:hypothetical protein
MVAVRPSYIQDVRFLKIDKQIFTVDILNFVQF